MQLVQLQEDSQKLKDAGIVVVGISYDPIETLKKYADSKGIEYSLLSDEGSKTIDAYGIRNMGMEGKKFGPNELTGIPHPGTYILDKEGVIRAKLFLERYQVRHTTDQLIEAAKKAQ